MPKILPIIAGLSGGALAGYLLHDEVKKNVDYGSYLVPHKYYVFRGMRDMHLPLSQALAHDNSKFRPDEWVPYSNWFNGPSGLTGTKDRDTFLVWRDAVNKHYTRNDHHWRANHLDPDQVPTTIKLESIADWYGVQRAKGITNKSFKDWFEEKKNTFPIDKPTVEEGEARLKMASKNEKNTYTDLERIIASGDPMVRAITKGMPPEAQRSVWRRYAQVVLRNRNYGRKSKVAGDYIKTKVREQ
jgi:Family of unknown function (DUF5662)